MKKWFVIIGLFALSALSAVAGSVTLEWNANPATDQVTKYSVYQATGTTGTFVKVADITTGTTYTVSNLNPGVYQFRITASNSWGESLPSNIVTTPTSASAPTGLKITVQ